MTKRRAATRASLLAFLLVSGAAAETENVRLAYEVPPGCPTRADFEAEVKARTNKVSFGRDGRAFDVRVESAESGFVGILSITEPDGPANERKLDGGRCEDVVSGLALVAALAVDPEASTLPRSELVIDRAKPVEPPAPKEKIEKAPDAQASLQKSDEPPREPAATRRFEVGVGLNALLMRGPTPVALVMVGPEVELGLVGETLDPQARLALLGGQTGLVSPEADRARFRLLLARLELCPLARRRAPVRWAACAVGDIGLLHAEGRAEAIAVTGSESRLWFAAGAEARAGLLLRRRFYVDLHVAGLFNVTRDEFVFEVPTSHVYDVPWGSWSAGLSAGIAFP